MDTAKIDGITLDKQNLDSVQRDVDLEENGKEVVEGDAKTPVADEDGSEKGEEEDSDDDEEAETSLAVVGAGDWD